MCLINMCDSTTVKRDESMTGTQNITHVPQCFSRVLHLVQPWLVDVKGAHSTVPKKFNNPSTGSCNNRVRVRVCESACATCEVLSLQSCELCVGGGAVVTAAVSSVCLKLPWQPNTKISLP